MSKKDRIIFALDVNNYFEAARLVALLKDHVGLFKVGLELFMAAGPDVLGLAPRRVMLDMKLHDIPETVTRAVNRAACLNARMVTLHVQQRETMRRAAMEAAMVSQPPRSNLQLLAVTVLTSMDFNDCADLSFYSQRSEFRTAHDHALKLALLAWDCGITGFVCSPHETAALRAALPGAVIVTPGIRLSDAAQDDQRRVGTPKQAFRDGADYIVVGRPIRDAKDPVAAAQEIAKSADEA